MSMNGLPVTLTVLYAGIIDKGRPSGGAHAGPWFPVNASHLIVREEMDVASFSYASRPQVVSVN